MGRSNSALKIVTEEHVADLNDVEEFAGSLNDRFLYCRELGHNWRKWRAKHREDGTFDRTLRCNRCYCKRIMVLSTRGMVLSSHYEHPEGYLNSGHGRITGDGRGILRLESLKRELEAN